MNQLNWRHTSRFVAAAFLMDSSAGLFLVSAPCLAESLGADSLDLGVLGAVRGLSYAVACIVSGLLIDRWSRRGSVLLSCCALAGVVLLTGLAKAVWQIDTAIIVWSLALAFYWPALLAWVGDSHSPAQLGRATAVINIGWSVGLMAGSAAAGWLYEARATAPFLASAPLVLAACAAALLGVPAHTSRPTPRPAGPRRAGSRRRLAAAWVGNFAALALVGLMEVVFLKLWLVELAGTKGVFGTMVGVLGVGRTAVFVLGLRRSDWLRDWRVAVVAQAVAAVMVGSVAFAGAKWWIAVVFLALGAAVGTTYYLALYRSLEHEGDRGFKAAMHEATLLGGLLVGSLGGGAAAHAWGLRAPYALMAALVVLLIVAQVVLNLHARRDDGAV